MTNEGVFPKVNGDVLYASEVNRFDRTNVLALNIGSNIFAGSSTDYVKTGSVLIPGGTFLFSDSIMSIAYKTKHNADDIFRVYAIQFSGTTGNNILSLGSGWAGAGGTALDGIVTAWIGLNGGIAIGNYTTNYGAAGTVLWPSSAPRLNVGSAFEIATLVRTDNTASGGFTNLLITKQVGGVY